MTPAPLLALGAPPAPAAPAPAAPAGPQPPADPTYFNGSFDLQHAQMHVAAAGPVGPIENCVELRSRDRTLHTLDGFVAAQWTPQPFGYETMELVIMPLAGDPVRVRSHRVFVEEFPALELSPEDPVRVFLQPVEGAGVGAQPFQLNIGLVLTGGAVDASTGACTLA